MNDTHRDENQTSPDKLIDCVKAKFIAKRKRDEARRRKSQSCNLIKIEKEKYIIELIIN